MKKVIYLKHKNCSHVISGPSPEVDNLAALYVACGETIVHIDSIERKKIMGDPPYVVFGREWMEWLADRLGIPFSEEIEAMGTRFRLDGPLERKEKCKKMSTKL